MEQSREIGLIKIGCESTNKALAVLVDIWGLAVKALVCHGDYCQMNYFFPEIDIANVRGLGK